MLKKKYIIIDKKCHDEERWSQVPGEVYTSLTTKLKVSYEEVLTKRRQDGCQSSRTRKESFERKPQRDFADKAYDNSIDWRKANLTKMMRFETSMYEILVNDCVL